MERAGPAAARPALLRGAGPAAVKRPAWKPPAPPGSRSDRRARTARPAAKPGGKLDQQTEPGVRPGRRPEERRDLVHGAAGPLYRIRPFAGFYASGFFRSGRASRAKGRRSCRRIRRYRAAPAMLSTRTLSAGGGAEKAATTAA